MTIDALKIISDAMTALNLNYELGQWSQSPSYPYFVGEYQEVTPMSENGMQETVFTLTGFTRFTWATLEAAKTLIENHFDRTSGSVTIADSGNAIVIFYNNAMIVPTGDAELKRMDIQLSIQEWKVT